MKSSALEKYIFLSVILISSVALADYSIKIDDKVESFLNSFIMETTNHYRSGLVAEKLNAKKQDRIKKHYLSVSRWKKMQLSEYEVDHSKADKKFENMLISLSKKNSLSFRRDAEKSKYIANAFPEKTAAKIEDVQFVIQTAIDIVNNDFEFISDDFEFDYYGVEYLQKTLENEPVIDSITVFFRRIFKGGIVRKDISSFKITFNSEGNPCTYIIKWPLFTEKKQTKRQNLIQIKSILPSAAFELKKYKKIIRIANGSESMASRMDITGIALGWFPADITEQIIMTPCYSFVVKVKYENGFSTTQILDIPAFKKYHKNRTDDF